MSQVSRSRARRDIRWRKQAVRLITEAMGGDVSLSRWLADRGNLVDGFDVARVREHCQRLIAEADDLDTEREVFVDWTRARGMGPENRSRGAFKSDSCEACGEVFDPGCPRCDGVGHPCGGWPGALAREYAAFQRSRRRCSRKDCDDGVLLGNLAANMAAALESTGRVTITGTTTDGCGVACPECQRFEATPTPRTFANGGNLRRAAQRLLDTLDGRCPWAPDASAQPSECGCMPVRLPADAPGSVVMRNDTGADVVVRGGVGFRIDTDGTVCTRCNGTGHNLRGVLPPLPEVTQRKLMRHHVEASIAGDIGIGADVARAIETMTQRMAESTYVPATMFYGRHQSGNDNP